MKQYIVFGPVWGQARGDVFSQIIDLEPIGVVRGKDPSHAMRNAKSRGFYAPIIQQKEDKNVEPIPSSNTHRAGHGSASGRADASAHRNGYTRKS